MTNGHWGVCRSAPPIPEPGELKSRYLGAGGADFDKGDFVTGFPYPRSTERPRRGRCKPHKNLLPCASSFAIKTGNREHKTTGAVVSKCALLYRSGVLQLSLTKPASHDRPFTHSGARAGGGISARCGGVPRDPHPHPDGNTPSGPRIRRGCKGLACFSLLNY